MLVGVVFIVASIRAHPRSEAGNLTGSSRTFARLMGIATGMWLIGVAVTLFAHNLRALLGILVAFPVLYIAVAVVLMVAGLSGGPGRAGGTHRR